MAQILSIFEEMSHFSMHKNRAADGNRTHIRKPKKYREMEVLQVHHPLLTTTLTTELLLRILL